MQRVPGAKVGAGHDEARLGTHPKLKDTEMKPLLIATALTLGLSGAALAQMQPSNPAKTGLSRPVIQLTGILAKNMDALKLNDEQRADVKNWVATMPANRKALEAETVELRAALRQAIVDGKPTAERQAIADQDRRERGQAGNDAVKLRRPLAYGSDRRAVCQTAGNRRRILILQGGGTACCRPHCSYSPTSTSDVATAAKLRVISKTK